MFTVEARRRALSQQLTELYCATLGVDEVTPTDDFYALGGDSLAAVQLSSRAAGQGLDLPYAEILRCSTVAELVEALLATPTERADATLVAGCERRAASALDSAWPPGPVGYGLAPAQLAAFEVEMAHRDHWTQYALLRTPPTVDRGGLEAAVQAVVAGQAALRTRFELDDDPTAIRQASVDPERLDGVFRRVAVAEEASLARTVAEVGRELQASLSLRDGAVFRTCHFDAGATVPGRLLMIAHQLVIDAASWNILIWDLESAYARLCHGRSPGPSGGRTPYRDWIRAIQDYAASDSSHRQLRYWRAELANAPALRLDREMDAAQVAASNVAATAKVVTVALDPASTGRLLRLVPRRAGIRALHALLVALVEALSELTGQRAALVDVLHHGREPVGECDVSRTVGWFTSQVPLHLRLPDDGGPRRRVSEVAAHLGRVPDNGLGFGALKSMGPAAVAQELRSTPSPQVSFTFTGRIPDDWNGEVSIGYAAEWCGDTVAVDWPRPHLLEVTNTVIDGALAVEWWYSTELHRPETVHLLAERYLAALRQVIDAGSG